MFLLTSAKACSKCKKTKKIHKNLNIYLAKLSYSNLNLAKLKVFCCFKSKQNLPENWFYPKHYHWHFQESQIKCLLLPFKLFKIFQRSHRTDLTWRFALISFNFCIFLTTASITIFNGKSQSRNLPYRVTKPPINQKCTLALTFSAKPYIYHQKRQNISYNISLKMKK